MRKLLIFLCFLPFLTLAQVSRDYAVLVTAENNASKIELHWPISSTATNYYVYRKLKSDLTYGSAIAQLAGTAVGYTDNTISAGECYEYYIRKVGSPIGYGYIVSGPCSANDLSFGEGRVLLLVDSSQAALLSSELDQYVADLEGEGWSVIRSYVSPSASVNSVKQLIKSEYDKFANESPSHQQLNAVILFGHIPVPYSGNLAPDAHSNHIGAWPADAFYGDMDGNWTDAVVNVTTASDTRNHNVPGDGKFDQSVIPSDLELQVGRIDLSLMPAFSKSETELLRQYLNKNHAYRTGQLDIAYRGLIDDNFGGFNNEAFAASGWKAFSTFFGPDSLFTNVNSTFDYRTDLNARSYLWSYGCGGGSYTSAGGIGNTAQLATDSLQSVFTLLFGSYFGDWDKTNSFLRAPLAQGLTLTNAWSGRPHWYFHQMAMGENIGHSFLHSINNNPYYQHYAGMGVHIALMGDPTLRMYVMKPPTSIKLKEIDRQIHITWKPSPEAELDGYRIYRKDSMNGFYHLIDTALSTDTSAIDTDVSIAGTYFYSVRPYRMETSKSGTFHNVGSGVVGEIETIYVGVKDLTQPYSVSISPNPANRDVMIEIHGASQGPLRVELSNLSGQVVLRQSIELGERREFRLPLSDVKNGLYVLNISNTDGYVSKKLVVMH